MKLEIGSILKIYAMWTEIQRGGDQFIRHPSWAKVTKQATHMDELYEIEWIALIPEGETICTTIETDRDGDSFEVVALEDVPDHICAMLAEQALIGPVSG